MDDLSNPANTVEEAEKSNEKLEKIMESKNLDFNSSKCSFLVAGNPKARRKLQGKVDKNPLLLCKYQVKQAAVVFSGSKWTMVTTQIPLQKDARGPGTGPSILLG